jgi:hypothetical protein
MFSEMVSSVASTWTYSGEDIRRFDKNKVLQVLVVSLSVGLAQSFCQSHDITMKNPTAESYRYVCVNRHFETSFAVLRIRVVYRGADKSLARPGRKQATATEDFDFHISNL